MGKLKVAVVGLRGQAGRHIRLLQQDPKVELHRVYYHRPVGPEFGHLPVTNEISDCLDSDVVIVASPTPVHAAHLEALRDFGGYILVEKPAASKEEEVGRLRRLPSKLKSRVQVNFNFQFHDLAALIRQMACSPQIGRVFAFDVHMSHGGAFRDEWHKSWRLSDEHRFGALETVGIHYVQFALAQFGPCRSSEVLTSSLAGKSHSIDTGAVTMLMDGDVWVSIRCSYAAPFAARMALWGTNGYLLYDGKTAALHSPRDTFDGDRLYAEPPVENTWAIDFSPAWDQSLARSQRRLLEAAMRGERLDPQQFDRDVSAMNVLLDAERGD